MKLALMAAVLILAACDETPRSTEAGSLPLPAAAVSTASTPVSTDDAFDTTSYEVGIAVAAANRNRALEQCGARPAAERKNCRTEVQSRWEVAKAALEDLRGDQPQSYSERRLDRTCSTSVPRIGRGAAFTSRREQ